MAAAWHFHRIPKYTLEKKAFGVFRHRNNAPASPYLAGFSDDFAIPVSRWTEVRTADIQTVPGLDLLMESDVTGPCLLAGSDRQPALHVQPHRIRLHLAQGRIRSRRGRPACPIDVPHGYFPTTIPPARRSTAGARTPICCSATGSTRSIRPRPTTWTTSGRSAFRRAACGRRTNRRRLFECRSRRVP